MTLLNSNIFDLRKSQHSAGTFINICMKKNRTYTEILISTSYDQRYDLNLKNITNNFDFSSRLFPTKYSGFFTPKSKLLKMQRREVEERINRI